MNNRSWGESVGAGTGGMIAPWDNPADSAMNYYNKIPGTLKPYFDPYINAGNRALPQLEGTYGDLVNSPGDVLNRIGANYQQSPGFQFALKQALQGAGHAAAAGGMAGSPQHEFQNMQLATQLGNQDFNNWISQALGLYGRGLSGRENLYETGAKAGMGLGEDLASMLANQAKLAYEGQNLENMREGSNWGAIGSGISKFLFG